MSNVVRNKHWGYEVEVQAVHALSPVFPGLKRTGASSQKVENWPDLVRDPLYYEVKPDVFTAVISKEKGPGKPLLITMRVEDYIDTALAGAPIGAVAIQVKGRSSIWLHKVYEGLKFTAAQWVQPFTRTSVGVVPQRRGSGEGEVS